ANQKIQIKYVIEFILLYVSLFGLIFLVFAISQIRLIILIPLIILIWIFFFYLYKKRFKKLLYVLSKFSKIDTLKQTYQVSVMISVGILIYSLEETNLTTYLESGVGYIYMHIPLFNPLLIIPLLVVILGFC